MRSSIRARLMMGFTLVLLLMSLAGGYLYFELKSVTNSYNQLIDDRAKKVSLSEGMMVSFCQEAINVRSFLKNLDLTGSRILDRLK